MAGVTPHGIHYPDGASKAKNLGPELEQMALDIDVVFTDTTEGGILYQLVEDAADEIVPVKVDDYISGLDLVLNDDPRIQNTPAEREEDAIAYSVTFQDGKRTVLDVRRDGELSDQAIDRTSERFRERGHFSHAPSEREEDAIAYAVTFQNGNRTALELRNDGAPTDWAIRLIAQRLQELGYLDGVTVPDSQMNVLFVTADDMDIASTSAFGGPAGLTPNLEALAASGMCFDRAYGDCAVCMPARSSMMTGRHTVNHGSLAIHTPINSGVPLLPNVLNQHGYLTACLGKTQHYVAQDGFQWDIAITGDSEGINNEPGLLGAGRSPEGYYEQTSYAIQQASNNGQPFFLSVNLHDPHRPFHDSAQEPVLLGPDEIASYPDPSTDPSIPTAPFPNFLLDTSVARSEYQHYIESNRRADDTFGRVMDALNESGQADNTLVVFMSDHGMPFPFAKEEVYHHSTANPFILRWPGVTPEGTRESTALTNCQIDIMPTILDAVGVTAPAGMDGKSLRSLIESGDLTGRDEVHFSFHARGTGQQLQMRATVAGNYLYIWNRWAELGTVRDYDVLQNGSPERDSYENATDPDVVARRDYFKNRQPEELYDISVDPGCLTDLSADAGHASTLDDLRGRTLAWMQQHSDPQAANYTYA